MTLKLEPQPLPVSVAFIQTYGEGEKNTRRGDWIVFSFSSF